MRKVTNMVSLCTRAKIQEVEHEDESLGDCSELPVPIAARQNKDKGGGPAAESPSPKNVPKQVLG